MNCWGFWQHSTTTIQILAFRARRSRDLARRTSKLAIDKSLGISDENTLLYAVCSDCEPIGLLKTEFWSEANLDQTQIISKGTLTYLQPPGFGPVEAHTNCAPNGSISKILFHSHIHYNRLHSRSQYIQQWLLWALRTCTAIFNSVQVYQIHSTGV